MAIYHFHVTQIKRSAGSSAVASAAYRAGERLYSERYGEVNDYTKKSGVICSDILLPPNAPEAYRDRQTLWNAVEAAEKRADAQLAYSFDIALPNELSREENIRLAETFIRDNLISKGMIADFSVHDPDRGPGGIANPHVHIMCPMRPVHSDGSWGAKQRQELILDENGDPVWDEKHKRYKFNAVPSTDWGTPETLEKWRENWCRFCNEKLAEKGFDERIDHRSYERQGIDLMPQIHEGPAVRAMEAKGIPTEKGEFNRFVRATNEILKSIRRKLSELSAWIRETREELSRQELSPSVTELLLAYMEQMRVGAMAFSKSARNKATVTTLKDVTSAVAYLETSRIVTVAELQNHLEDLSGQTDRLLASMKEKSAGIRTLKDALAQYKAYSSLLPVIRELEKPKYRFKKAKEAYKAEHETDFKLFYRARRILKEAGLSEPFDDKQIRKLQTELADLEKEYQKDYAKLKPLREEKNQLLHIRYCVDRVIQATEHSSAKEIPEAQKRDISL